MQDVSTYRTHEKYNVKDQKKLIFGLIMGSGVYVTGEIWIR